MMSKLTPKIGVRQANNPIILQLDASVVAELACDRLNPVVETLGEVVRVERLRKGLTQAALGNLLGLDGQTISNLESGKTRSLKLGSLPSLAESLAIPIERVMQLARTHALPPGISSAAETAFVPQWDIDLRASAWAETPCASLDGDDPVQAGVLANGRFRLRILGACMEPDYPDGMLVEFQVVRVEMEPLEPGADYAVCRSDGTATFKQLARFDEHTLFLRARNRKAYPEMLLVPRQEVCRMARVVWRLNPPPTPKLGK